MYFLRARAALAAAVATEDIPPGRSPLAVWPWPTVTPAGSSARACPAPRPTRRMIRGALAALRGDPARRCLLLAEAVRRFEPSTCGSAPPPSAAAWVS